MQLLLDGQRPVLVTLTRRHHSGDRVLEFHTQNDNGTTSVHMAVVLGVETHPGDYVAIGQAVMAVFA